MVLRGTNRRPITIQSTGWNLRAINSKNTVARRHRLSKLLCVELWLSVVENDEYTVWGVRSNALCGKSVMITNLCN